MEKLLDRTVMDKDGNQYPLYDCPLWWHEKGLQQTASGYGKKLTTRYKVQYNSKMCRLYCHMYSNIGTCYIIVNKKEVFLS